MIDLIKIQEYVAQGYILCNKHPTEDLYIYNYTRKTQYENFWNEETLTCRGLILDGSGNIVAQPFRKFFNLEDVEPSVLHLPNKFKVFEKLDGVYGILYWIGDVPYIASRGSFVSLFAQHATEVLHSKYSHLFSKLNRDVTYGFEIISPQSRIVIDYKGLDDLILIGGRNIKTGADVGVPNIGFPVTQEYPQFAGQDLYLFKKNLIQVPNREGYVLLFENGLRIKIKFDEYKRIQKIQNHVSTYVVWELLYKNENFEEFLDNVPDEFDKWLRKTIKDLWDSYYKFEADCKSVYKIVGDRKTTAAYFLTQEYPEILFAMYDNKNYSKMIWKHLKPKYEKGYLNEL